MRATLLAFFLLASSALAAEPDRLLPRPEAFPTLINPRCSHCQDEARRRAGELRSEDPVLAWTRGYSEGGAIPIRFFLAPYRVISDSYGVFVYDPEAGFARGFAPSYRFRFHGWRNGIVVMKDTTDGTLYSGLSGVAFEGPRRGERLAPVPTLATTWGSWLNAYPNGVAYHMFAKYRPVELPQADHPDSVKTRGKPDPRLRAEERVLGIRLGDRTRAYPLGRFPAVAVRTETLGGEKFVILHNVGNLRGTAAYRLVAHQPRTYRGPQPNEDGVSPPDAGRPLPEGKELPPRPVELRLDWHGFAIDQETGTLWDSAGRGRSGALKGWTLEPVDAVVCKWFAWAAEYPRTELAADAEPEPAPKPQPAPAKEVEKEVAGTAEFLRVLPKPFATLKAVDARARTVTLQMDGEQEAKSWPVEPEAELKIHGWWGRLEQFRPGERVWAWLKLDRQKKPVSVVMLADAVSEWDLHGSLVKDAAAKFPADEVEAKRTAQKAWLRKRWIAEGLPGTLTFHHVFSGELELMLDHEAMRWGRSLKTGDVVHLTADPPIKGVVRAVTPWRERTLVRLVVGELESADLKLGQRLGLKMTPPPESVDASPYPSDIGRPRSKAERIEWFLASLYCVCPVGKDTCTGHFYTLASCNPNGCGAPTTARKKIGALIDQGKTDQEIWDDLLKSRGPLMTKPHLKP